MTLSEALDAHAKKVNAWMDQTKKELAAVHKLQQAAAAGNLRDIEKLRQAARNAADAAGRRATECERLDFDASAYLAPGGDFLPELQRAAWQVMFDHLVFQAHGDPVAHLPEEVRGVLGSAGPEQRARMRATLLRSLGAS